MTHPVAELLRQQAAQRPQAAALVLGSRSVTWNELYRRSSQAANAMLAHGVVPGYRVAFVDKNSIEFFEFFFGCALCGGVPVPISWRFTTAELQGTIRDADVRLVMVGTEFVEQCAANDADAAAGPTFIALGEHPSLPNFDAWIGGRPEADPRADIGDHPVVMQLYTSGTTGLPKGVLISAGNLQCLLQDVRREWDIREADTSLVCMPLFHMGGVGWALAGMASGARSVIVREFTPAGVLDVLQQQEVTVAFFVPAMLAFLCAVPGAADRRFALRRIVYSGSPITQETLLIAMTTFRCEFVQIYGMSETTGSFAQLGASDHDPTGPRARLLRSAGRPYPWVDVRVVDVAGTEDYASGEVGEIWTRSAQNTPGYWNNDAETGALLTSDGWLKTGDAGYMDEEGFLFLTDRIKDMIISGGENVYPAEVENALAAFPALAEIAVIGVPSDRWGETVKAIVAVRPGSELDEAELIRFAKQRLAGFKCPTSVDVVSALPRSPTGKVLKKVLREPYWTGRERAIN